MRNTKQIIRPVWKSFLSPSKPWAYSTQLTCLAFGLASYIIIMGLMEIKHPITFICFPIQTFYDLCLLVSSLIDMKTKFQSKFLECISKHIFIPNNICHSKNPHAICQTIDNKWCWFLREMKYLLYWIKGCLILYHA